MELQTKNSGNISGIFFYKSMIRKTISNTLVPLDIFWNDNFGYKTTVK